MAKFFGRLLTADGQRQCQLCLVPDQVMKVTEIHRRESVKKPRCDLILKGLNGMVDIPIQRYARICLQGDEITHHVSRGLYRLPFSYRVVLDFRIDSCRVVTVPVVVVQVPTSPQFKIAPAFQNIVLMNAFQQSDDYTMRRAIVNSVRAIDNPYTEENDDDDDELD